VRWAIGAAAIVALFVIVLAAVPFFVDLDRYRDRWLPAVESALGRRVEVGRVELTVLTGLGARLDGLAVHGDPDDPSPSSR
jgi:AsmA protein